MPAGSEEEELSWETRGKMTQACLIILNISTLSKEESETAMFEFLQGVKMTVSVWVERVIHGNVQ